MTQVLFLQIVITVLGGALLFSLLVQKQRLVTQRRKRIQGAIVRSSSRMAEKQRKGLRDRRKQIRVMAMGIIRRFAVIGIKQDDELIDLIQGAGFRSQDAVVIYTFVKLFLPFFMIAFVAMWAFGFGGSGEGAILDLFVALAIGMIGSRAPDVYLGRKRTARLKATTLELPDTLDTLVICTEAGLSFDAALRRVVSEMRHKSSVLADELSYTVTELGLFPERDLVFERMAARLPSPSIVALVNTILQSERFGTPLARALRVLSDELRNDRAMAAEHKAAQLPATMTIPLMIFILPPLFIILIGPAILDVIATMSANR